MKIFLTLAVLIPVFALAQVDNVLINQLEFGPYIPGYRLLETYDRARPPLAEQRSKDGRIIPIYFWYPSVKAPQETMTFKSYLNDLAYSLGDKVEESNVSRRAKEIFTYYHFDTPDSIIQAFMNMDISTLAYRDGIMADGNFPLAVFNHGNVDRWWIWGEFLASHGIVAIGTPIAGTFTKRHEMGLSGLETQIRDAQFAVSVVSELDNINKNSIIAVGYSYGSLTAAGFATRDQRVKGVVSLDGIIADVNEGELLTQSPYFDYQRFNTPILHLHSAFSWSSNYTILDRLIYADQYRIEMANLRHSDYHFEGMADLFGCNFRGGELKDHTVGFSSLTQYVLAFIKGVSGAHEQLRFLSIPVKEVVKTEFIKGSAKAYSADDLLAIINTEGFDKASDVYKALRMDHSQPFSTATFYEVGITLHRYRMIDEEYKWFEYYIESYPKSADAQYRLARLTSQKGNKGLGIELLKKTIEMIPYDPHISQDRKTYLLSRVQYFLGQ